MKSEFTLCYFDGYNGFTGVLPELKEKDHGLFQLYRAHIRYLLCELGDDMPVFTKLYDEWADRPNDYGNTKCKPDWEDAMHWDSKRLPTGPFCMVVQEGILAVLHEMYNGRIEQPLLSSE